MRRINRVRLSRLPKDILQTPTPRVAELGSGLADVYLSIEYPGMDRDAERGKEEDHGEQA